LAEIKYNSSEIQPIRQCRLPPVLAFALKIRLLSSVVHYFHNDMLFLCFLPLLLAPSLAKNPPSNENAVATDTSSSSTQSSEAPKKIPEKEAKDASPRLLVMLQKKFPQVYMQIIKIKERVIVNSKQQELSRSAIGSDELYKIGSDGKQTNLRSRLFLLSPRTTEQRAQALSDDELDWFDKLALALRLDRFWPRVFFSMSAGFAIVSLGFLTMHLICLWMGWTDGRSDDYISVSPGTTNERDVIIKSAKMQMA
jgi:hypothetical protein